MVLKLFNLILSLTIMWLRGAGAKAQQGVGLRFDHKG